MLTTSKELRTLHDRITKMGKIDDDKLFTVLIINSLGCNYAQLQSSIHGMTDEPNFTSIVALKRIETEASLEQRHAVGLCAVLSATGVRPFSAAAVAVPSVPQMGSPTAVHCTEPYSAGRKRVETAVNGCTGHNVM
jgi:hypothetical protein